MIVAWLQRKAIALMAGAIGALMLFGGVQSIRLQMAQGKAAAYQAQAKAARQTADQLATMRDQEQAQAATSYTELSDRCEARVDQARKAASLIEEITNGTITHPSSAVAGKPAGGHRAIVPAGQLRGIIGQAAAGQAAGVSAGSKPGATR